MTTPTKTTKTTNTTQTKMDQLTKGLSTKSAKIRVLDSKGYTRSEIAKYMNIRYQHVRNVLITPLVGKKTQ